MTAPQTFPISTEPMGGSSRLPQFTQFLVNKDRVTRLALGIAAGATIVAILTSCLAIYYSHQPVIFVVVDSEGNVLAMTGAAFPEARDLHVKEAMLATTALLSRNPRGFDQPEFLQAMFSKTALAEATQVKEAEDREFMERQIQQKPQVFRIEAITTHKNEIQIQVVGEVMRWGTVRQAPYSDSIPFTLRLVLRHNPDFLRKRHQPLVIEKFTLTYAPPTP